MMYRGFEGEPGPSRTGAALVLTAQLTVGFIVGNYTIAAVNNIPDAMSGDLTRVEGLPATDFVNSNEFLEGNPGSPHDISTGELLVGIAGNMAINGTISRGLRKNLQAVFPGLRHRL